MILGDCYVGRNFCFLLRFPTVVSERSMSRCMFRSRSYVDMRHWFSCLLPCHVIFSLLDGMMRFCYKDWVVSWSLYAAFSMPVALIMVYIKLLGSHLNLVIEDLTWRGLWILWTQIHTGSRVEWSLACGISWCTHPNVKLATLKYRVWFV